MTEGRVLSLSERQDPQDPNTIPVPLPAGDDPTSWETLPLGMCSGTTDCHIITRVPPAMRLTAQAVLGNRPGVRSGGEKGDEGLGEGGPQSP